MSNISSSDPDWTSSDGSGYNLAVGKIMFYVLLFFIVILWLAYFRAHQYVLHKTLNKAQILSFREPAGLGYSFMCGKEKIIGFIRSKFLNVSIRYS